jgi:uncharacterized Zn-finger protein
MSIVNFDVSIPTDGEFLGRECGNSNCRRYFRIHTSSIRPEMYCPYCGMRFSNDQLHTADQVKYMGEAVSEKALEYMHHEVDAAFAELARETRGSDSITFEYTPARYKAKPVAANYREQKVDSELVCPLCTVRFQVFGVIGFCPGCRTENMLIYDANLAIIRREIESSKNPQRALRHAYNDLVSTFASFCAREAKAPDDRKNPFQGIAYSQDYFKQTKHIDILRDVTKPEILTLNRAFQKRHAYQHEDGKITGRYLKVIPEDAEFLGTQAVLTLDEFEGAARVLGKVLNHLIGR